MRIFYFKGGHRRARLFGLSIAILLFLPLIAHSAPILWETDLGSSLSVFKDSVGDLDKDEGKAGPISLSFSFPFPGHPTTAIFVGVNGGIHLKPQSAQIGCCISDNLEGRFYNRGQALICPFCSDLDLNGMGTVHFNDFGDHAVITWNQVGSFNNDAAPFTFQTQLFENGNIIMAWKGIPLDLQADLGQGIVVGITPGDESSDPGERHFFPEAPFSAGTTIYETWGMPLGGFSLDNHALTFVSKGPAGYNVRLDSLVAVPEPGLVLLFGTGLVGLLAYRRFKKSEA